MMRNRLILAFLSFSALWSAKAMAGGTLLKAYLPQKTFIIPTSRFSGSSGSYLPPPSSYRYGGTRVIFNQRAPVRHHAGILTHSQSYSSQNTATNQQGQAAQQQIPALPQQPSQQQTQRVPQQQRIPVAMRTRISNTSPQQAIPQRGSVQQSQGTNNRRPGVPRLPVRLLENTVVRAPSREPKCYKIPPPGECRGAFPRYYYNNLTDQCDCFLYGGCGAEGLAYSYKTLEECHDSCAPSNKDEGPVCQQIFQEEDYYFDEPNENPVPPDEPSGASQIDEASQDVLLTILLRASPADTLPGQRIGP